MGAALDSSAAPIAEGLHISEVGPPASPLIMPRRASSCLVPQCSLIMPRASCLNAAARYVGRDLLSEEERLMPNIVAYILVLSSSILPTGMILYARARPGTAPYCSSYHGYNIIISSPSLPPTHTQNCPQP